MSRHTAAACSSCSFGICLNASLMSSIAPSDDLWLVSRASLITSRASASMGGAGTGTSRFNGILARARAGGSRAPSSQVVGPDGSSLRPKKSSLRKGQMNRHTRLSMVKSRKLPHSEPKTESHARYLRKCRVHTGTVSQVKSGHFINNLHATDLYSTGSCASFRDGVNVNVNVNNRKLGRVGW